MGNPRLSALSIVCLATFLGGVASPAQANVPLAEKPLYLGTTIKPAFIMAVDDSGSMQWDVLSPNQDGELVWGRDTAGGTNWGFFRDNGTFRQASQGNDRTGDFLEVFPFPGRGTKRRTIPPIPHFGFARSHQFNAGYYDPGTSYGPWLNYDGSSFESMDTTAEWQSIKIDPRSSSALRYDLTNVISDRSDDGAATSTQIAVNRDLFSGYLLRQGWEIRARDNQSDIICPATPSNISVPSSSSSPLALTQNYTLTGPCYDGNSTEPVNVWIAPWLADYPESDGNGEMFDVREGMVIPAGTQYFVRQPCAGLGTTHATIGTWVTLAADVTLSGTCDQNGDGDNSDTGNGGDDWTVGFRYFAPTYYLTTNTSPDGNVAPTTFTNLVGGPRTTTTPGGGTLYRYEIKPGNYNTYAEYEAAMTNFANWWLYYRTRNLAMVAALTRSLNDVNFMRIGFFRINDTQYNSQYNTTLQSDVVMHEMSDFTNSTSVAGRRRLYEDMLALPASGSTPNAWAVTAMGNQFKRTTGTTSPTSGPPIESVCQFNAGMLFTDGYHNQGRPTTFGNVDNTTPHFGVAPFKDNHSDSLADIAADFYKTNLRTDLTAGLVPVVPGCASATPDPRLDCNRNLHMNLYGITLGASGVHFGNTYQQDQNTLAITPDVFVTGNAPAWAAFAENSRSSVDDLWHATLNARGQYINATSPARISQAMNAIIESINNSARRSAGTAASGARRAVGFTAYVPEFDPNSWTGDLKAYSLLASGALGTVQWSAVEKLPDPALRNILVSLRKSDDTAYELKAFTAANLGTTDTLRRAKLGLTDSQFTSGGAFNGRTFAEVMSFLRGDPAKEGNAPGLFRTRLLRNADGTTQHRPIGDILGSQPEVLDRGTEGYSILPVAEGGRKNTDGTFAAADATGTYSKFVATTKKDRVPVIIVSANDGMVHGFNANTSATGAATAGVEVFSVIPNSVLGKTGRLLDRNYVHTYLADGSPRLADACIGPAAGAANCSWKTVAVMGMGTGGKSVMALDVTDPVASFGTSNLLWEVSSLQDADIGFVINRPRVFIGEDKQWYAAFGNGLNSTNHKAYVYIVNLKTGAIVRKIQLGTAGSSTDPNGAVSVAVVDGDGDKDQAFDEEFNPYGDTMYVNDYHGRLFKIDLSSQTPASWAVAFGGAAMYTPEAIDTAERADKRQFVTGGIDVALHPLRGNMVFFGTGKYIADGDQNIATTPQVQTFYGIWDDPLASAAFSGRTPLVAQSITGTKTVSGITRRQISENLVPYTGASAKRGWYIDLYQAGTGGFRSSERVVGQPRVIAGNVIFTTFQPIGSQCNPGGKNFLYSLSAVTGANALNVGGCDNCGAADLNPDGTAAPPTPEPPIVVDPQGGAPGTTGAPAPPTGPAPGGGTSGDPRCLPGTSGCSGLATGETASGRTCLATLSVLLPNGLSAFTNVPCGRQAWRQIQ